MLKKNPDGKFSRMINHMGKTMAKKLGDLAEQSYNQFLRQHTLSKNYEDDEETIISDENYDIRL